MDVFVEALFVGLLVVIVGTGVGWAMGGLFAQESDSTMSMSGGFGSITLDGEIYNQISFSLELVLDSISELRNSDFYD